MIRWWPEVQDSSNRCSSFLGLATCQGAGHWLKVLGGRGPAACSSSSEGPRVKSIQENLSEPQLLPEMLGVNLFIYEENIQRCSSEKTQFLKVDKPSIVMVSW